MVLVVVENWNGIVIRRKMFGSISVQINGKNYVLQMKLMIVLLFSWYELCMILVIVRLVRMYFLILIRMVLGFLMCGNSCFFLVIVSSFFVDLMWNSLLRQNLFELMFRSKDSRGWCVERMVSWIKLGLSMDMMVGMRLRKMVVEVMVDLMFFFVFLSMQLM